MVASPIQYVTLVSAGGTPVRLADQTGAPYPTTGQGSLVFSNNATLTNATINGIVNPSPFGLPRGTLAAPALYFGSADNGFYSQFAGDISLATSGALLASLQPLQALFSFNANAASLKLFSDVSGETIVQSYNLAGSAARLLSLQKYGANVAINQAVALTAGGLATAGNILFGTAGVLFGSGTGAPTLTAPTGSLYLRHDASQPPYYNTTGATTWDQLVGVAATQTLTNKTLTAPTINGGTISGATFTTATLASPTITGTVAGGATYTSIVLTGPALGTPVSGVLTNATGYPVANLAGAGAGVLAFLATPSSANLATAVTDETGTAALVFANAPTLVNPVVGTQSANDNSTKAASTAYADRVLKNLVIRTTIFTTVGANTWTVNANTVYAVMEAWGGGGGGGGTANSGAANRSTGGGGGAGGYSRTTASKATVGASQTVTIGAAGTAGASGNNAGGAGGDTSVGALAIGKGGTGGTGNTGAAAGIGGAGGIAGTGTDVTGTGMDGFTGALQLNTVTFFTGRGGSSSIGSGVEVANLQSNGSAGTGKASGGGGGTSSSAAGAQAGGAGTAGYVVITEFCSS